MILQPVINIAEICARKGVKNVVLSPGSRCAPLTIAFARHPQLTVKTVSDERAAAFIALGMALTTGTPTVLICTSGTAALNYAPAVAEAFFQQVPLLLLTADRPTEWIDQLDGQTIRQQEVYGRHIKKSYNFPSDFENQDAVWHSERLVSEALNEAIAFPQGPVHINVPLREPFYPAADENIVFGSKIKIIEEQTNSFGLTQDQVATLKAKIKGYKRVLIVVGQQEQNTELLALLRLVTVETGAVVIGDIISNIHTEEGIIRYQDTLLTSPGEEELAQLQPELLITFGKSIISKSLKLYFRKFKPDAHWHIQPAGPVADTFQALTNIIRCSPTAFFGALTGSITKDDTFANAWHTLNRKAANFLQHYFSQPAYSEIAVVAEVLKHLPAKSNLHLANSMAVRYANTIGLTPEQDVIVYANRGTSGIDGSTSTAVGCALTSSGITTLLTGDMAFFYDRNGLWHNYLPGNLRIVLLNNHAGGIFRLIDGPKQQPELEPFFETYQALDAQNTARDFGLKYTAVNSLDVLRSILPAFFASDSGAGILEVFTESPANATAFANFKQALRTSL